MIWNSASDIVTRCMVAQKITVTGASGVGKSTLAKELSEAFEIPLIPELARQLCAQLGYQRIGEIPDQEEFKKHVLSEQIKAESQLDSFVSDRSVIDCWVLWQRWNICSAMTYDTEAIYEQVIKHVGSYSHIVYVPPLFQATEDGFRWIEPDYIKQIDRIIRMTFHDLNIWDKVYTIKTYDVESRVQEIKKWLQA